MAKKAKHTIILPKSCYKTTVLDWIVYGIALVLVVIFLRRDIANRGY